VFIPNTTAMQAVKEMEQIMLNFHKTKFGDYVAEKDGRRVAFLRANREYTRGTRSRKTGTYHATTYTHHIPLNVRGTLPEIKAQLATFEFPSAEQEYEMEIRDVEKRRREYKSRELAVKLADAARAVINGSNYATETLRELTEEIERFVKDRSDHVYHDGRPSGYPYYPEPL